MLKLCVTIFLASLCLLILVKGMLKIHPPGFAAHRGKYIEDIIPKNTSLNLKLHSLHCLPLLFRDRYAQNTSPRPCFVQRCYTKEYNCNS